MKYQVQSIVRVTVMLSLLFVTSLLQCTMREGDVLPRLNPLDPLGDTTINKTKYITVSPTWSDFSFIDSTGSLQCSLLTAFEYCNVYYGKSDDSLTLFSSKGNATFEISGFNVDQTYIFKFAGYFRNGDTLSEVFSGTTPSGTPPAAPDDISGEGTFFGAELVWNRVSGITTYTVHRFDSLGHMTVLPDQLNTICKDTLQNYNEYTYIVGSNNNYGTALSNTPVAISKIASILPPDSCHASDGLFPDYIKLTWNHVTSASAYRVYRSAKQNGNYSTISFTADTIYNDSCLAKGTFFYKVASINDSGYTGASGKSVQGSITDSLDVPSGVIATNGELPNRIAIIWDQVPGAQYYKIYRSTDSNGVYAFIDSVAGNYNYFTDSSITQSVNYYKVSVVDSNSVETNKSDCVAGSAQEITAPANVSASEGVHLSVITVTWDTIPGAQEYYVYRAVTSDGPFSCVCSTSVNDFADTVGPDYTEYYKVSYRYERLESSKSASVKGWTMAVKAPQNLTATLGTYYSHIVLQWQNIGGATAYAIYRSDSSTGTYEKIAITMNAQYSDSTVATNDYYYYRVAVVYHDTVSGPLSVYTQGYTNMLERPDGLVSGNISPQNINLTWNTVTGADYYVVYRSLSSSGVYTAVDTVSDTSYYGSLPPSVINAYYKIAAGVQSRSGYQSAAVYATLFLPPSSITFYRQVNGIYLTD